MRGGPPPEDTMDIADLERMQRDWGRFANGGLLQLGMASRTPNGDATIETSMSVARTRTGAMPVKACANASAMRAVPPVCCTASLIGEAQ